LNLDYVGNGKVILISGGGKSYTDMAAKFCRSEDTLEGIIGSDYDKNLVKSIINSSHLAATEFDYFIFGVEGYSRVTEVQLVRKRLASYLIKTGTTDKKGNRGYDIVLPKSLKEKEIMFQYGSNLYNTFDLLKMLEIWYNRAIGQGISEGDARYIKPQGTEFKAIIGMNAHALLDWFKIRCCLNAQAEIRDMANKMLTLCRESCPELFEKAGSNCKVLGYCPENKYQNKQCIGKIMKHSDVLNLIKNNPLKLDK